MCRDLLGRPYRLGADGTDKEIDCIALTVTALERMGIENPGLRREWYGMTPRQVLRELKRYTVPIERPTYDGDIVVLSGAPPAFGVVWQRGILYINQALMKVDWKPVGQLSILRSYRMKES